MLDLDLEVFHGPFDLLLTLVLRRRSTCSRSTWPRWCSPTSSTSSARASLDLEAATEFLVLIAALLS